VVNSPLSHSEMRCWQQWDHLGEKCQETGSFWPTYNSLHWNDQAFTFVIKGQEVRVSELRKL